MTFEESLKILDIEEYGDRIFKSNSHGELFHLMDYIQIADAWKDDESAKEWFVGFFKGFVKHAEENWNRPESVFQHVLTALNQQGS